MTERFYSRAEEVRALGVYASDPDCPPDRLIDRRDDAEDREARMARFGEMPEVDPAHVYYWPRNKAGQDRMTFAGDCPECGSTFITRTAWNDWHSFCGDCKFGLKPQDESLLDKYPLDHDPDSARRDEYFL